MERTPLANDGTSEGRVRLFTIETNSARIRQPDSGHCGCAGLALRRDDRGVVAAPLFVTAALHGSLVGAAAAVSAGPPVNEADATKRERRKARPTGAAP